MFKTLRIAARLDLAWLLEAFTTSARSAESGAGMRLGSASARLGIADSLLG